MKIIFRALAVAVMAASASAQVTTIRVEIDYMVGPARSHMPQPDEIAAVVQMFACQGIALIVDVDDNIGHVDVMKCASPGVENFFSCTGSSTSFSAYRAAFRDQGAGWHYCIFGDRYDDGSGTSSSGLAEILGNDLFVADGVLWGQPETSFWRAATFAHELGHNLGLRHFSPSSPSQDPYSPNLPSIMSYQYQLRGVKSRLECLGLVGNDHRFKELDYSDGSLPYLDESALIEDRGVDIRRVDWDCNGIVGGTVSKSLDSSADWCSQGGGSDALNDFNEWAALMDVADAPGVAGDDVPLFYETCVEVDAALDDPGSCGGAVVPALTSEPCPQGGMYFVDPSFTSGFQLGTGNFPFQYLSTMLGAPEGSVAYLQPGVHTSATGASLVFDNPLVLAGPGGAVIDP